MSEQIGKRQDGQFDMMYRKYAPMLLRRCMVYVKNRPDAEDITHAVFIKALEKWEQFRGDASPYTWLYRITTNLCLNHLRDHRHEIAVDKDTMESLLELCRSDFESPLKKIVINEVLTGFCSTTKKIVFLTSFERLSQEEISETLGISRTTVQKKWNRFIESARKRLKEV
jgi:RNA polymerase sigma-70 factor (ECF subfamily)